tara:strand:- start:556 stop:1608 length:1053 start_codon:yes stop_codon:yes gene_type:complete
MSTLLSKSPYHVNVSVTDLIYAEVDIYIYTGEKTVDRPTNPSYTLKSTAINGALSFDIGSLVNDAIQYPADGTYRTDGAWLDYEVRKYTDDGTGPVLTTDSIVSLFAVDGYSYFHEGANFDAQKGLCLSTNTYYVPSGESIRFPINKREAVTYKEFRNGNTDDANPDVTVSFATNNFSGQQFTYPATSNDAVDRIQVITDDSFTNEIKIVRLDECKYEPIKIKFVNRYGAMEDLWFFKTSKLKTKVESKDYQNNQILSSGAYNTYEHQFRKYNTQARESLTINSGFVTEDMNEAFTQLLMSSKVWATYNGNELPVNVKTTDIEHKTSLNDKLIQYTMDVDFAFNKINTIR